MTTTDLFRQAEQIYENRLRRTLEKTHINFFVAIEPVSGDHYLGRTLSEASAAAQAAHPGCRSCVLRVGHSVTVHIGVAVA